MIDRKIIVGELRKAAREKIRTGGDGDLEDSAALLIVSLAVQNDLLKEALERAQNFIPNAADVENREALADVEFIELALAKVNAEAA